MTAICGIFHIKSEFDGSNELTKMMQPVSYSEKVGTWQDKNIALGQHTFYTTPESIKEELPFHQSADCLTIVGDIRLDDRAALFSKLAIPQSEQKDWGDARLVLASYQKWGQSCNQHLLGDFAFAIWDGKTQQLFCCRDHMGAATMYYFFNGRKFIFASDIRQILAVTDVPSQLNYNKLTTFVAKGANNLFWGESWFEDIPPFPAGTSFIIDGNGIKKYKYWTPRIEKELHYKSEAEYVEAFREIMFKAVEDRMRSNYPVTALLSGGLDSSAIVSIAAKILEKQNKQFDVFSAVLENDDDPVFKDERYYIDLFRTFPNININYIRAEGKGFFSDLEKFKSTVSKPMQTSRHYLYDAFAQKAESIGSRHILDGAHGELGPTYHGYGVYAEMFGRFQWLLLRKELIARKKTVGESIYYNFRYVTIRPYIPQSFVDFIKGYNMLTPPEKIFLQPDFAGELRNIIQPRMNEIKQLYLRNFPNDTQNMLRRVLDSQSKAHSRITYDKGMHIFPFLDKRIIEFSLSLPLHMRIKNGYKRYMIRAGLDNILPKEIQWRNTKSHFSPDYYRRYNTQLKDVRMFLDGIEHNDPVREIVNIDKLKSWAERPMPLVFDKKSTQVIIARDLLPQAIYLIHFMRRFTRFKN